jgi:glycosyltransferase involved in cell wall biosynthesis
MRICLVSHEFAPFYGGGAGTYASVMCKALTDHGHEVHVVCADATVVAKGYTVRPAVKFHGLDWDESPLAMDGFPTHDVRQSLGVYERLKHLMVTNDFDYIEFADFHAEGYHCLQAKRVMGSFPKTVLGVRLHIPLEELRAINDDPWIDREVAYNLALENACIRDADIVFSPARAMLDVVRARLPGAFADPSRPALVVRNPFDESLLAELGVPSGAAGAPSPAATDEAEVLFIGRLTHGKGADLLAAAARVFLAAHPQARLRMVGADTDTAPGRTSMLEHVRRVIGEELLKRATIQPEHVPREKIGPMIAAARVCVFPSRWENFPYACLEAMALGAMVVGADAGGLAEIIEHERSGLLFRSGDVGSLAAMIGRGLTDDGLHAACAAAAPARVRELCDPRRIVSEVVAAVEGVRNAPEPRRRRSRRTIAAVIAHNVHDPKRLQWTVEGVVAQGRMPDEVLVMHPPELPITAEPLKDARARTRSRAVDIDADAGARAIAILFNAGLRACASEYVAFFVSGDAVGRGFFSTLERVCDEHPDVGFVLNHPGWGFDASAWEGATAPASSIMKIMEIVEDPVEHFGSGHNGLHVPLPQERDLLCVTNVCGPALGIFRVDELRRIGGFNESLAPFEDWALFCALAMAGVRGEVVPKTLVAMPTRERDAAARLDRRERELLRASILRTFPMLAETPGRALRFMAAECGPLPTRGDFGPPTSDAYAIAERLIAERLRYRIADRLNAAIKRTKWHALLRRWMSEKEK